jgi:hypothetical protein
MRATIHDVIRKVKGIEPISPMEEELLDLMDEEPKKVRIIRDIDLAFTEIEHPADPLVDDPLRSEPAELAAAVRGRHWRDLRIHVIIENRHALAFFTAAAFRHYLPAFLIAALAYPRATDVLWEMAFSILSPPDEPRQMTGFLDRVEGFDAAQRDSLRAYVALFNKTERTYPDPVRKRAMDFWQTR